MTGATRLPTTTTGRVVDDYFLDQWRSDDPWGLEDRWYEQRKRDLVLASLPSARFAHAFEPGCAQGMLTARLADRCDRLTALELVPAVAARAAHRCRDRGNVDVRVGRLPTDGPRAPVDLVVASEVLYYLTASGLDRFLAGMHRWLEPAGTVVGVHWTGSTNYPMSGVSAHERLHRAPWLRHRTSVRDDLFVLDVWQRT